ncbi:MAG TPA: hypothetical protein VIR58_14770 [Acidimicrobiales bacterium]
MARPTQLEHPIDDFGPVPEANQPGHHPPVEQDKPTGPPPGPAAARKARAAAAAETILPRRFPFAFDPLMVPAAALAGVLPGRAEVVVDAADVTIRFGRWSMSFPRSDVEATEVTGPYRLVKVAGPPHLSLADRGITFATNRRQGLCLSLRRPHRGIEPLGLIRHPGVTVTVEDVEGLKELLDG